MHWPPTSVTLELCLSRRRNAILLQIMSKVTRFKKHRVKLQYVPEMAIRGFNNAIKLLLHWKPRFITDSRVTWVTAAWTRLQASKNKMRNINSSRRWTKVQPREAFFQHLIWRVNRHYGSGTSIITSVWSLIQVGLSRDWDMNVSDSLASKLCWHMKASYTK